MSNNVKKPRVFAWHIGGPALRHLGDLARMMQADSRKTAEEAAEKGERVVRPYSPGRAEKEGMKSRYPKR